MLSITTALEFSEMDDLFTAICQSAGVSLDVGWIDHLSPPVEAVIARHGRDHLLHDLMAAMLRLCRPVGATPSALDPGDHQGGAAMTAGDVERKSRTSGVG